MVATVQARTQWCGRGPVGLHPSHHTPKIENKKVSDSVRRLDLVISVR